MSVFAETPMLETFLIALFGGIVGGITCVVGVYFFSGLDLAAKDREDMLKIE